MKKLWKIIPKKTFFKAQNVSFHKKFFIFEKSFLNDMKRMNIGIFGSMNSGKSTLMNLLTQSEVSIVDSKPGTTADVKVSFMEIHGIGPTKIFDTPGINEEGELGLKKKKKAFTALSESDLCILVVNPFDKSSYSSAQEIVKEATEKKKPLLIVYNIRRENLVNNRNMLNEMMESFEKFVNYTNERNIKSFDFHGTRVNESLINFIKESMKQVDPIPQVDLLPKYEKDSIVFLNIPMDEETPTGRLLKPQSMVLEYLLRNELSSFSYRMDLRKARSKDPIVRENEMKRFQDNLRLLLTTKKLQLVITDSQAIDIVSKWTIIDGVQINVTTFSIIMINFMSGGRLDKFVQGIKVFDTLKKGDKLLICEACNHNRIIDDIGTVQIPQKIKEKYGQDIEIDFAFGRDYQSKDISIYKLLLHCGGCMLDQQKMNARIKDLEVFNVPITNYGLALSYFNSKDTLKKVLNPWRDTIKYD